MPVQIKRVYDGPAKDDGLRILVDGLWPRGLSKENLQIESWLKEIAPSPKLRQWYGHKSERWAKFRERYRRELAKAPRAELVSELAKRARRGTLTLVFAAKDSDRSNAAVISEVINKSIT